MDHFKTHAHDGAQCTAPEYKAPWGLCASVQGPLGAIWKENFSPRSNATKEVCLCNTASDGIYQDYIFLLDTIQKKIYITPYKSKNTEV